eukprot:14250270-Alexandrium_andersonii.AAC.1
MIGEFFGTPPGMSSVMAITRATVPPQPTCARNRPRCRVFGHGQRVADNGIAFWQSPLCPPTASVARRRLVLGFKPNAPPTSTGSAVDVQP